MAHFPHILTHQPPKLLHVANLSVRPKGAGFFGVPFKLSNGFVRAGYNVLNFSDRDVARASSLFHSRKFGVGGANRKLIEVVRNFCPDIVILGHADIIRPATLDALRTIRPGIRIAQWSVDPLFLDEDRERVQMKIDHVDWTFSSTGGALLQDLGKAGNRVAFLPNPVDLSIERARNFRFNRDDLPFDVFYAAGNPLIPRSHGGINTTSSGIASRVMAECPGVRGCFPGCNGQPLVFGDAYEVALASATMGLNISRRSDVPLYSSDRFAHLAGSGLLVFVDRATGYTDIFSEDEFAFYSTEEEMIDRINYFMAHDAARKAVAERGWHAYVDAFDTVKVASYMVSVIMGEVDPSRHVWRQDRTMKDQCLAIS